MAAVSGVYLMPAPVALPGEVVVVNGSSPRLIANMCDADFIRRSEAEWAREPRSIAKYAATLRQRVYLKRVTTPRKRGRPSTAAYRHREPGEK